MILMEFAFVYFLINRFHETYISGSEATAIAVQDVGLAEGEAVESTVKLKHKSGIAWYNIRFEKDGTVYLYEIDAEDGSIRSSKTE